MEIVMQRICILGIGAFMLAACDDRPAQWDAYVYPGDDLMVVEKIRGFKTFELCQAAAMERLSIERPNGGGSYECGYKCEPMGGAGDLDLCRETRK